MAHIDNIWCTVRGDFLCSIVNCLIVHDTSAKIKFAEACSNPAWREHELQIHAEIGEIDHESVR
jgi:hypothetical protein